MIGIVVVYGEVGSKGFVRAIMGAGTIGFGFCASPFAFLNHIKRKKASQTGLLCLTLRDLYFLKQLSISHMLDVVFGFFGSCFGTCFYIRFLFHQSLLCVISFIEMEEILRWKTNFVVSVLLPFKAKSRPSRKSLTTGLL